MTDKLPRGRPKDAEREIALVLGDKLYTGTPCHKCAMTLRYTNGGRCAHCAMRDNLARRDAARPERQKRFSSVAEHVLECAKALDNFGEAVAQADHDLLESSKDPWD